MPEYGLSEIKVPIYTGANPAIIEYNVIDTIIVLSEVSSKWVKQRKDENCESEDPNDCLVWSLVETPQEVLKIEYYLTDTTITDDFVYETIEISTLIKKGGFQEWMEVVCVEKLHGRLVRKIQMKLLQEKLDIPGLKVTGMVDQNTKKALAAYQRKYDLPVGNLDKATMSHLGFDNF